MAQPPLLLQPLLKRRRWGGRAIAPMLDLSCQDSSLPGPPLAEAWLCADLPASIPDGICAASPATASTPARVGEPTTFREVLQTHSAEWLGSSIPGPEGRFPLLIKILDAAEHLSVQVHPDAAYAAAHPSAHMKSEAWIVLQHEPGAHLFRGLTASLERASLRRAMESGDILQSMIRVPARVGEAHWLPSGICHALGEGITAFEVQTPSDTTFRAWDWNRRDPSRPLHLHEAEACMLLGDAQQLDQVERLATARPSPVPGAIRLVETPFFAVDRVDLGSGGALAMVECSAPRVVWCWQGAWTIDGRPLSRGASLAFAARTEPATLRCAAEGTALVTTAATRDGTSLSTPGFQINKR